MKPTFPVWGHINVAAIQREQYIPRLAIFFNHANAWRIHPHIAIMMFLLCPVFSYCTSIVAIFSNNTVVIASDSKERHITTDTKSRLTCKLHVGNDFAWTTSGLTRFWHGDPQNGVIWDPDDAIRRVAKTKDTARAKVATLDKSIPNLLLSTAERMRTSDPQAFDVFSRGALLLETLLIGFENGEVTVSHREYRVKILTGKITIATNPWKADCPGYQCDHNPQAFFTGEREALEVFFVKHPEVFRSTSPDYLMKVAIQLVGMEIAAAPELVGPPIQTAIIDGGGIHWGENNSVCANGKETNKHRNKPKQTKKNPTSCPINSASCP
jgi:hypothetical protein